MVRQKVRGKQWMGNEQKKNAFAGFPKNREEIPAVGNFESLKKSWSRKILGNEKAFQGLLTRGTHIEGGEPMATVKC